MIEVKNLTKRYGNYLAVNDISFTVKDGEILGFLGPNGAGKTTTMNMLTGYLSSTSGDIEIDSINILDNPAEAKSRVGYLPEQPPLYLDMTVKEYLDFVYDLKKVRLPRAPHIAEICRLVKIDHVFKRLIKNLSKGYRQRVGIAQALIGNPDVLILDEPTVGLDPKQIIEIRNLIAHLGKTHTVILSSHILSEVQAVCERVIVINRGQMIADDTPDNLAKNLSTDMSLTARIEGPKNDVLKLIKGMGGVKSVVCNGMREPGAYEYNIEPNPGKDIRKLLFSRLSDRHWPLLVLRNNELTLEEIFIKLTEIGDDEIAKIKQDLLSRDKAAKDAGGSDSADDLDEDEIESRYLSARPDDMDDDEDEEESEESKPDNTLKDSALKIVDNILGGDDDDDDEDDDDDDDDDDEEGKKE